MSNGNLSRQISLAPHVRSTAAIADHGEVSGSPSPTADVALPGGIPTPTWDGPVNVLPPRGMNSSFSSKSRGSKNLGIPRRIPYKFTLVDLNTRSYFLIHEVPETTARTEYLLVNKFRDALRQSVLLANVEVCLIRNCQLAGWPANDPVAVDLSSTTPEEPPEPATQHARRAAENTRALAPIAGLLSGCMQLCTHKDVAQLLEERIQAAEQILADVNFTDELAAMEDTVLHELAFTFAAYQPAALDEELKGSQSPCDPRSHTRSIQDVLALVDGSVRAAGTDAPEALARLAMRLLDMIQSRKPDSRMAGWLLQVGCMSGHAELVSKLLDRRSIASGLFELDIIRRLRTAWLGYTRYRPLQPARSGAKAQTIDWLDFKCSCARAVVIAYRVIETLILRDDKELTRSVQMEAAAAAAATPLVPRNEDPSVSLDPAADDANGDGGRGSTNGVADEELPANQGNLESRQKRRGLVSVLDRGPLMESAVRSTVGAASAPRGLLDDGSEHVELEPSKWAQVRELFPRAVACKPLALAMLHVILADKRKILRAMRADAAAAMAAAAGDESLPPLPLPGEEASADAVGVGGAGGMEDGEEAEDEEDEEEAVAGEEAERARVEEEARATRYRKLHLLAVQACHLAVHSNSLSTVSDALACIRAVRAWPAIDMAMLNDLAEAFPHQCAALLGTIPLQEVDLEDNVLPFGLPPGFTTVAVSDKDAHEFQEGGGAGSTQDAAHFATQRDADASIESSLLVLPRTWFALLFLFWPAEFASPTTRQLLRVMRCALAAFLWQGPGSCAVAAVFAILLLITGAVTRCVVAVARIVYYGILYRIWAFVTVHFPVVRRFVYRVLGRQVKVGPLVHARTGLEQRITTSRQSGANGSSGGGVAGNPVAAGGAGGVVAADHDDDDDDDGKGFTRHLGLGIWRTFFAHGHNALIDGAVGWGRGAASISCRKLPMPMVYSGAHTSNRPGSGRRQVHQPDTALLEKLLRVPGLHPSVFGSKVLRALILFKWNHFTKYFIILQLLLHTTYMGVFLAYAFSIKDMEPVDGREHGPGANTPGCQLQAPTPTQTGLLIVLAVMTVDFLVQELRQIRHFGFLFFRHTWDLLDVCSVALVVASITLHFTCTSGVSPLTLRGLAAVQIVLLFMRLLYYAMASDKLGSFVRMVLETTYDLFMFFGFLSVVFVGFALAIIISQGSLSDEEQTFIKLFTMMYGDFDVNFLSTIESGALGLDALTRVLASVYMILVTIILLNLLISVISESYERIRENEKWESLRNKALLVVESETQLWQFFLTWLYTTLTPPTSRGGHDNGRRYVYVIAPEYARRTEADGDDEDADEAEADDQDEDEDDGQWNGRLGEMKRHISSQSRATIDVLRREVGKVLTIVESVNTKAATAEPVTAAAAAATAATASVGEGAPNSDADRTSAPGGGGGGSGGGGSNSSSAAVLDEGMVQKLVEQVGALVGKEVDALRKELLAEIAKKRPPAQDHGGGRPPPLPNTATARTSLPPLNVAGSPASGLPVDRASS